MSVWLKDSLGLEERLQRCTDIGAFTCGFKAASPSSTRRCSKPRPRQKVVFSLFLALCFLNPIWQFLIENVNPDKHKVFAYWRYPVAGHRWAHSNLLYSGDASREEQPTDCAVIHLARMRQGRWGWGKEGGAWWGWGGYGTVAACTSSRPPLQPGKTWKQCPVIPNLFQLICILANNRPQRQKKCNKFFGLWIVHAGLCMTVCVYLCVCVTSCVSIQQEKLVMETD